MRSIHVAVHCICVQVVNIWMNHLERIVQEMDDAVHKPLSALSLPGEASSLERVTTLSK